MVAAGRVPVICTPYDPRNVAVEQSVCAWTWVPALATTAIVISIEFSLMLKNLLGQ
jgi:hypothetical protein